MRTGTGPAPRVAHSIALLAGDTGGQSADNPDFTDLYYPLCVSRRIDTWQIVYLSYKEPCPTILTHKRYTFMSHECTCDQYPFNGQMHTGTGPALVYFNDTSSKYGDHNLTIRPSISAINRSSECVIYATLVGSTMVAWISKRLRLPPIIEARTLPGASQALGNDTTRELHLAEFIVHRRGGGS